MKFLISVLILTTSFLVKLQAQESNILFVIKDNGDSLAVVRGTVKLAQSTNSKGIDHFFISINDKWTSLAPHSYDLKNFLSQILPDFEKAISKKKIHYNLASLGNTISEYNEFIDPNFRKFGSFKFPAQTKIGIFGSIGSSLLDIQTYATPFERSTSKTIGIGTHFQSSRIFSIRLLLAYSQIEWKDESWDFKLKTINLSPLANVRFYDSKLIKLSASAGFNLNMDIASRIEGPIFTPAPLGLGRLGLGYDFQLHCFFGRHFETFISYQIMNNQRSQNLAPTFDRAVGFNTNEFRLGVFYFL